MELLAETVHNVPINGVWIVAFLALCIIVLVAYWYVTRKLP